MTKIEGYLGLAKRGGKMLIGEPLRCAASKNRVCLVLIAQDIAPRARIELEKCLTQSVKTLSYGTKQTLGISCGGRPVNAIGITDEHLAQAIAAAIISSKGE